ncbi:MAG: acylphosphatase [Candidatus Caldarchaeum sp.]|nr:acylphosphatase [Candidatus Caldarchaeum sp.]MDW8435221.1 acylphosphatase [Candidatus Caldarchaeum sp.]
MENVIQRAEITVDGVVQGVGFRYYVRRTARRFSVLGYVQNLDDGTVKITCEGRLSSIEKFAEALRNAQPHSSRYSRIVARHRLVQDIQNRGRLRN